MLPPFDASPSTNMRAWGWREEWCWSHSPRKHPFAAWACSIWMRVSWRHRCKWLICPWAILQGSTSIDHSEDIDVEWPIKELEQTMFKVIAELLRFDSKLRKRLLARWLHLTIWLPDGQGAKGPGKQVYASETHLHISSLLSVYTHWGGEHRCHCTMYLFIYFVVH